MSDAVAIRVENLTFAHAHGPLVLRGVSFEVNSGECVGLVGPNGAGKTTLFLCLAGVYQRRGGSILVAGLDPAAKDQRKKLPSHVGIVFQDSDDQLFNTTVLDDVVGRDNVLRSIEPTMGSEDFAYMLKARPGAYVFIGNGDGSHRSAGHGLGPCMLHNPSYDFNDELIPLGATFWVRLVERFLAR